MTEVEALVSVTQAYATACYTDEATHSLGDVIRMVDHVAQIFNQVNHLSEIKHLAVVELCKHWNIGWIE
jgi:hypothetical protein